MSKNKKSTSKERGFHFHQCGNHKWRHDIPKSQCDLSKHAGCGFGLASDLIACIKGKHLHLHSEKTVDTLVSDRIAGIRTQSDFLSEMLYNFHKNREDAMQCLKAGRKAKRAAAKAKVKTHKIKKVIGKMIKKLTPKQKGGKVKKSKK